MSKNHSKQKNKTARQMHVAILAAVSKRSIDASESQYDRKVCIRAVGAAEDAINRVPIKGTAIEYGHAVSAILSDLQDNYNDSDGEYTSGKGPIGDVYYDVLGFLDEQLSIKHGDVNKKEVRRVIITEMAKLSESFYDTTGAVDTTPIKINAQGASGTPYFLEITFETTSDREFAMHGKIYNDPSCKYPIMEDRTEFISDDE